MCGVMEQIEWKKSPSKMLDNILAYLESHKIGVSIQSALTTLIEVRPANPIEFLALNYDWEPERTSHVRQAATLLRQVPYNHGLFPSRVQKAYLTVSQCPAQKGRRGLTGDIHMDLLHRLTEGIPDYASDRLMERLYCRTTEVVPFSVFRAAVCTCLIFREFMKEVTELYTDLDLYNEGQTRRSISDAILTQLWNSCLPNKDGSPKLYADVRASLCNIEALNELVSRHRFLRPEQHISLEQFQSQAVEIFLLKVQGTL